MGQVVIVSQGQHSQLVEIKLDYCQLSVGFELNGDKFVVVGVEMGEVLEGRHIQALQPIIPKVYLL